MKFRDMFKVRRPGNGDNFNPERDKETVDGVTITDKGKSVPNGGDKKGV